MFENFTVRDVMSEVPHTVDDEIALSEAIHLMKTHRIRHLPVQRGGKLVGVLSDGDAKLAVAVHPAAKEIIVSDVMSEHIYAVSPETALTTALSGMAAHKYGCVVVQNHQGRAIGIFTASDAVKLLAELLSSEQSPPLRSVP